MMCLNRRVVGGLAVVALAVLVFAPSAFGRALPLLVAAACPLGMLMMARSATGACHRKAHEVAEPAADAIPDAAAEIARLRNEVEQLRAVRAAGPSASPESVPFAEEE